MDDETPFAKQKSTSAHNLLKLLINGKCGFFLDLETRFARTIASGIVDALSNSMVIESFQELSLCCGR
jgi:hypothetical protein